MKRFFGGVFIEKEKLAEVGINHPIKLEYYKQSNEEISKEKNIEYGISIVKTEYKPNDLKIEIKEIENITKDENIIDKILKIFKENQVAIINSEEIVKDLIKNGI